MTPRLRLSDLAGQVDSHGTSLIDLIDSWSGHVLRLLRELDLAWEDPANDVWGVFDLAGAYYVRDRIDSILARTHATRPHGVELADCLLLTFTLETPFEWQSHTGQLPGVGWWWQRIPSRGPVRQEIDSWGTT